MNQLHNVFQCLLAGWQSILRRKGVMAKILFSSQDLSREIFPLVVLYWNEMDNDIDGAGIVPQNEVKFDNENNQTQTPEVVLRPVLKAYSEDIFSAYEIMMLLATGYNSDYFLQPCTAKAKELGVSTPKISEFGSITQIDERQEDNTFLYTAEMGFNLNYKHETNLGEFPCIEADRVSVKLETQTPNKKITQVITRRGSTG